MSFETECGTVHEKCATCEKWVCECELDIAPGDVAVGELGESGPTRVVPDSLPLIAGGRATVFSAYTVVAAIGLVGLAILWEVC